MSEFTPSEAAATKDASLRRRTVIGAAAWAAPVIVATVASPAAAASVPALALSLVVPGTAEVGTLAQEAVYATVLVGGVPAVGKSVTFMVVDVALGGFGGDGSQMVTVITDESGIAYPPSMVLKEVGDVAVTATVDDRGETALITVTEPVSTGTIAFKQSSVNAAAASTFALAGALTRTAGRVYPAEVALVYPAGFSGPETAQVDQATGEFVVPGITAGSVDGSITASAPGYGTATVAITLVLGYIETEQAYYRAGKGFPAPYGTYVITGKVNRVTPGVALPATVTLAWNTTSGDNYANVTGLVDGQTVNVDPSTGAFTLPTLTPIDTGRGIDGIVTLSTVEIRSTGYQAMTIALVNRPQDLVSLKESTVPAAIAFKPGEIKDISGNANSSSVTRAITYPAGFTGPATVAVNASGAYTIRGVKAPEYITAGPLSVQGPTIGTMISAGRLFVL